MRLPQLRGQFATHFGFDAAGNLTNHYSQTYNYDRYGNMACAPGSNYCNTTITFDVATNQINTTDGSGNRIYLYDAAGNLTQDGTGRGPGSLTQSFQWDGEGRLVSVDGDSSSACASGATLCFT